VSASILAKAAIAVATVIALAYMYGDFSFFMVFIVLVLE
jgi:hypothetical protein